jgi:hypothetical protein
MTVRPQLKKALVLLNLADPEKVCVDLNPCIFTTHQRIQSSLRNHLEYVGDVRFVGMPQEIDVRKDLSKQYIGPVASRPCVKENAQAETII